MNGKQLKNSILQWAIQGKLVPQDPNDEPASVLLKRIRAEKERLIKAKKIKRNKNESVIYRGEDNSYYEKFADGKVKCINDEIPFEIPNGWEWERLGNIFETASGSTPLSRTSEYYDNGSVNWVRTTDLNNGVLDKTEMKISVKACIDYHLTVLPRKSVCIAMYGGAGTIGKHAILLFDTTINQSVCAVLPNGECNMDFLHLFVEYQRPYWMDFAAGSRKDPNINQLIIKNCLIPIPPINEQEQITIKIQGLLPIVEKYSKAQESLDKLNEELNSRLKKSILQEAIQGKLVPQDPKDESASVLLERIRAEKKRLIKEKKIKRDKNESVIYKRDDNSYYEKFADGTENCIDEEIPFEIPESWSWVRLATITYLVGNKTNQVQLKDIIPQGLYPVISQSQKLIDGYSNDSSKFILELPLVMFGDHTRNVKLIDFPFVIGADGTKFHKCIIVDEYYIYYWMQRTAEILRNRGYARHYSLLKNNLIPMPPLKEQQKIVQKIENLLAKLQ